MRRGDCRARSAYFSAEFYLPNYGWIPADPTAADMADRTDKITKEERTAFQEFYFGNQDALRCNVQFDIYEAYAPRANGGVLLSATLRSPAGTLLTAWEPISLVLSEYMTMSAELLSGEPPIVLGGRMHWPRPVSRRPVGAGSAGRT